MVIVWVMGLLAATAVAASAQVADIQGVVNSYYSVIDVDRCHNLVRVAPGHDLNSGDVVLLIQMQGASVDTCGSLTSAGSAGRFERITIDRVFGDTIEFAAQMLNDYDPSGATQLVLMPSYAKARTVGRVTCPPWNGTTGGVVALTVTDTLFLDSTITATGAGFRLREGIAGTQVGRDRRWANAGAYGSGGAHGGCGGASTDPFGECLTWGEAISYSSGVNWLFMGGGGGVRQTLSTKPLSGHGGGIVIVDAPVIIGSGSAVIESDGMTGASVYDGIGNDPSDKVDALICGSGGGAGGALLLTATHIVNVPNLSVKGGHGGFGESDCHGAGGGGGVIRLGTITAMNLNPSSYAGGIGPANERAHGCPGGLYYNVTINESNAPYTPTVIGFPADTTVCVGTELYLSVTGSTDVTWMHGQDTVATVPTLGVTAEQTTTFQVIARYGRQCLDSTSVTITVAPDPTVDLGPDVVKCPDIPVTLVAPPGYARYMWSTGEDVPSIQVMSDGIYTCVVANVHGCTSVDSVAVTYTPSRWITIDDLAGSDRQLDLPAVQAGGLSVREVMIRNVTDSSIVIDDIACATSTVFSIPRAQLPLRLMPGAARPLTIVGAPDQPGEALDSVTIHDPCGATTFGVRIFSHETPWFTRCGVRITSDGEVEGALIRDMVGRVVQPPLSPGVYHVWTPTWSGLIVR